MLRIREYTANVHNGTYEISVSMCKSTVATTAVAVVAERLSVRRIIVGCILAMNDRPINRPTDLYTMFNT